MLKVHAREPSGHSLARDRNLKQRRGMRLSDHVKARVDWPVALRPGKLAGAPFRVYVIARERNAAHVKALAEQADGRIEIWPLEQRPGRKFDLLDQLVRERPPAPDEWLVVADDDIRIIRGDLARLIAIAKAAGFDLAQPGHDRRGNLSHGMTISRPLARARLTSFTEIGPLFAVDPRVRDRVTATFAGSGMGWGLDVSVWPALTPRLRFGVVDEVRMRHLGKVASEYDAQEALAEMHQTLAQLGVPDRGRPQETHHTWFAWHSIRPVSDQR
jgi:hypothetical protein